MGKNNDWALYLKKIGVVCYSFAMYMLGDRRQSTYCEEDAYYYNLVLFQGNHGLAFSSLTGPECSNSVAFNKS